MTPKVKFKYKRPEWGAMVRVHAKMVKSRHVDEDGETVHTVWTRFDLDRPVDAMFIGYRTLREGKTKWYQEYVSAWAIDPPEHYRAFSADNHFEGWLVVEGPQRKPFFALPVDAEDLTP